jgi:hypothetical protein
MSLPFSPVMAAIECALPGISMKPKPREAPVKSSRLISTSQHPISQTFISGAEALGRDS